MKKIYIQPQTAVVKISSSSMIAASPDLIVNKDGKVNAEEVDTKDEGDWDLWDEWDE